MAETETTKNQRIKAGTKLLEKHVPFVLPAMVWYYASEIPSTALVPQNGIWSCAFSFLEEVAEGKTLCISADNPGCSGASNYFGFSSSSVGAPKMLVENERFKKTIELGQAFYDSVGAVPAEKKYVAVTKVDKLNEIESPEVVTLWVSANSLSGLVTLANYDRETNDNVLIPFASGCQSVFTIPLQEKLRKSPKCVVGLVDPAVRRHVPSGTLSFAVAADRFLEVTNNVVGSFLELDSWKRVTETTR